mmetsp:Transcript_47164/g.92048  ORF Transcript_47164/g.92048 Transcript_47164/m.92048 type:complete len:82 (+) Transcript_47164:103-348(+)
MQDHGDGADATDARCGSPASVHDPRRASNVSSRLEEGNYLGGPSIMAQNGTTAPDPKMHGGGCSTDSSVGASVPTSSGFLQ